MREIALDTETTGLDPAGGHRMIEIGCVEMIGRVRTGKHFHAYLNPERGIPEEAVRIHGITEAFLRNKPIFASVVEAFLAFIAEEPLVIHNAVFDMKFINAELARLGFEPLPLGRATDTLLIARKKFPGAPANLDALCRRFEIDSSSRTQHGALLDAELLADVYLELMGGRQAALFPDGRAEAADVGDSVAGGVTGFPERHFPPSSVELEAHERFLSNLQNPLWVLQKEEAA